MQQRNSTHLQLPLPTASSPKISKSQQIYNFLSMTHRQYPQQIQKNWFKGLVLNDLCFPLENEYAKEAPGWRKKISWDAERKWWIRSRQMLFGNVMFCNSIMQSLSNGFPAHWFFLHDLSLLVADVWKAGHYTRMAPKTRTAIKFIQLQCWPQNYLHCLGSKMYSQWSAPSKTKGITACDQNRDRDTPSCNQEQQALMKPHAVTPFRLK